MGRHTRKIIRSGYFYIKCPEHPFSGKQGYLAEHRLIMEKKIGRYLQPGEVVHHINHNIKDNRIENLKLFFSPGQHSFQEHPEAFENARLSNIGRKPINFNRGTKKCLYCRKTFETTLGISQKKFCSHKCYGNSKKGIKATKKQLEALKKGHGWNKGLPMTWAPKGRKSPHFIHGRYSKFISL